MNVQIKQLKAGHDKGAPGGDLNVRKVDRKKDLTGLAASIRAHGLLAPLIVVPDPRAVDGKGWYVADGNRRLAAMHLLVKEGVMKDTDKVAVRLASAEEALELGLAANTFRLPLHPADQYVAVVALAKAGHQQDEIAVRFGVPVANVRRMLALGDVSPKVLAAWRDGKFGANAMKLVAEFTMATSHDEQDAVLAKIDLRYAYEGSIRRALGVDNYATRGLYTYVGREAYLAAGGKVVEDLFGDAIRIVDVDICERLAAEKAGAECAKLIADGWAWAHFSRDLPLDAGWSWKRAEVGDKGATGCILSINQRGELEIKDYVVMPPNAKVGDDEVGNDGDDDGVAVPEVEPDPVAAPTKPTISKVMTSNLSTMSAAALQRALPASPKAGLAALLAALSCSTSSSYGSAIKVRFDGPSAGNASVPLPVGKFDELLVRFAEMTVDQLLELAAVVAARGVDLSHTPLARSEGSLALATVLDQDALGEALRQDFDAQTYFAGVKKDLVVEAVTEALGEDEARRVKAKPKGDLVAFAVANIPSTGWLPPEIRHPVYVGPGGERTLIDVMEEAA